MAGRPRKELPLPEGFSRWDAVKVSNSAEFRGFKLGLITDVCKEGGIIVWLTGASTPELSVYTCIHTERGDTIQGIELK